jgi:type II secretion system protein N
MAEKKTRLLPRIAGYTAFTLFALVVTFFLTFPYDALKDRLRLEADLAGYFVRIGSMGPGFFAVNAKAVQLSKKADTDPPPEALALESVSVGPSLFPPGVSVRVKALGGTISTTVGALSTTRVKIDVEDLDLSKGNMKGFSGIDFAGTLDAHVDLTIPRGASVGNAPGEPDLAQASGTFTLDAKNLAINGGNVAIPLPQYGPEPTPMDLPKIVIGDVTGKVKIDKGVATFDEFKSKSADLELAVGGTMKLGKRLEYSEAGLEVRLKPDPEFQKRLGMIGGAFSMLGPDPKDPTWRLGRLTGFLGRPQFR